MGSGASKRQASYALGDSGVKRQETGQGDPEEASRRGGSSGGAGNGEGSAGAGAGGGASPRGGGTVAHLEAITGAGATAAAAGVMATGTPPPRDGAAACFLAFLRAPGRRGAMISATAPDTCMLALAACLIRVDAFSTPLGTIIAEARVYPVNL